MINRTAPHLPVQNVERATYREILERWAPESRVDFLKGDHRDNAGGVLPDINQILDRDGRAGPEALG